MMRLASVCTLCLVLSLGLFLQACETDDGIQGGGSSKSCDAGETKACGCTDGSASTKVCGDDDRWKACACSIPDTTPVDPYADVEDGKETLVLADGEQCTPDCASKQCGPDGCGGVCAQCPAGMGCNAGKCESGEVTVCGAFIDCLRGCYELYEESGSPDGCDETTCPFPQDRMDLLMPIMECMGQECPGEEPDPGCVLAAFDGPCADGIAACKNGGDTPCQPSCGDRNCGDDGCGGSCGSCDDGASCVSGTCTSSDCDCNAQVCGPNQCGDSCGYCDGGMFCVGESCSDDGSCASTVACGFMCTMADVDLESCLYDYCAPDSQHDPSAFFDLVYCINESCGQPADQACIENEFGTDSGCSGYLMTCVQPPME
jgi:hypothetical protein